MSEKVCLIENCERKAISRGLCHPCYQLAFKFVRGGDATWEQLIASGLALEASAIGRAAPSPFTSALKKQLQAGLEKPESVVAPPTESSAASEGPSEADYKMVKDLRRSPKSCRVEIPDLPGPSEGEPRPRPVPDEAPPPEPVEKVKEMFPNIGSMKGRAFKSTPIENSDREVANAYRRMAGMAPLPAPEIQSTPPFEEIVPTPEEPEKMVTREEIDRINKEAGFITLTEKSQSKPPTPPEAPAEFSPGYYSGAADPALEGRLIPRPGAGEPSRGLMESSAEKLKESAKKSLEAEAQRLAQEASAEKFKEDTEDAEEMPELPQVPQMRQAAESLPGRLTESEYADFNVKHRLPLSEGPSEEEIEQQERLTKKEIKQPEKLTEEEMAALREEEDEVWRQGTDVPDEE